MAPDREAIKRGLQFEGRVRKVVGGKLQPGSGSGWRNKSDVRSPLLFSCKATAKRSWTKTRRDLEEAVDYALGTGLIPALALLDDDEEELVVMRLSDLASALSGEVILKPDRSNADRRRERADLPAMLREE